MQDLFYGVFYGDIREATGEEACERWSELDRLLVQSWESRSIRPRFIQTNSVQEMQRVEVYLGSLLPEVTKRGIIDLMG